jgi:hypothetical protein
LIGVSDFELLNYLKIPQEFYPYDLTFDVYKILKDENSIKIDKIINNSHFYVHRGFYEQTLLYAQVCEFSSYKNLGINSNQYEHINQYIDIFEDLISVISEERLSIMNYRPDKWEEAVYSDLEKIKNRLVEEWKVQAEDLSIENFYEKNNKVLDELNAYVKNEIKCYKNKK